MIKLLIYVNKLFIYRFQRKKSRRFKNLET